MLLLHLYTLCYMSETTCYIHEDKAATTTCERCDRPICPVDHKRITTQSVGGMGIVMEKKLVCPECFDIVKSKQKARNRRNIFIAITMTSLILVIGYFWFEYIEMTS